MTLQLDQFTAYSLLLLRLMLGLIFGSSGYTHATKPQERGKDLGLPPGFTLFLGVAEMLGALGIVIGVLTQWACIGLILVMLGALQKKLFVWKSPFWGLHGWSDEIQYIIMLLVVLTTNGGPLTLMH